MIHLEGNLLKDVEGSNISRQIRGVADDDLMVELEGGWMGWSGERGAGLVGVRVAPALTGLPPFQDWNHCLAPGRRQLPWQNSGRGARVENELGKEADKCLMSATVERWGVTEKPRPTTSGVTTH